MGRLPERSCILLPACFPVLRCLHGYPLARGSSWSRIDRRSRQQGEPIKKPFTSPTFFISINEIRLCTMILWLLMMTISLLYRWHIKINAQQYVMIIVVKSYRTAVSLLCEINDNDSLIMARKLSAIDRTSFSIHLWRNFETREKIRATKSDFWRIRPMIRMRDEKFTFYSREGNFAIGDRATPIST